MSLLLGNVHINACERQHLTGEKRRKLRTYTQCQSLDETVCSGKHPPAGAMLPYL